MVAPRRGRPDGSFPRRFSRPKDMRRSGSGGIASCGRPTGHLISSGWSFCCPETIILLSDNPSEKRDCCFLIKCFSRASPCAETPDYTDRTQFLNRACRAVASCEGWDYTDRKRIFKTGENREGFGKNYPDAHLCNSSLRPAAAGLRPGRRGLIFGGHPSRPRRVALIQSLSSITPSTPTVARR